MEKRILLSFALSFLVILVFYWLFPPAPAPEPASGVTGQAAEPAGSSGEAGESVPGPVSAIVPPAEPQGAPPEGPPEPVPTQVASEVETACLESRLYSICASNRGAVIESLRLLEYLGEGGATLELLDAEVDGALGWPLEVSTGDPELDERLRTGLWVIAADAGRLRLDFAVDGIEAFKEIRVEETGYEVGLSAGVRRNGLDVPFALVWQGSFGDQSTAYDPTQVNLVYQEGRGFERLNVTDFATSDPLLPSEWLGLEDRYFLALFRGASPRVPELGSLNRPGADEEVPIPRIAIPYEEGLQAYIGPKQRDHLREVDPTLVAVIDYGFFQILAEPLLTVLLWIQAYVGNFGWSIILMTLLLNALLFPLRLKQQLSMLKMQTIQPQMKKLQEKYKQLKPTDPRRQEVQSEMMGLYQKHGVNPLGGCLPMVLQMPIFFAIFQLLRTAIELRQAPWMLWIQDLSAHDPYYVLPVMMGLSMVASQRMMPTTMDPAQARMMMFLPLMFMVFMVRAQSGLVLYWFTSQLAGVGQQLLINRHWAPKAKKEPPGGEARAAEKGKDAAPDGPGSGGDPTSGTPAEPVQRKRRRKKR